MLISLENISFYFGSRPIIVDSSWQLIEGQRVGLIGLNGAGKSTLLKIIDGQYQIESGSINKSKELQIGFLNQDSLSFESNESILAVTMEAFAKAQDAKRKMTVLEEKLLNDENNEGLLNEYHDAMHEYEIHGGYEAQHRAEEVLEGLGFKTFELELPFSTFSGGWRMRVLLAKLILEQPQLLLLDEPTNHLDMPAIEWLEKYIKNYPGAIVIISHDRIFLNQLCNELVEVDRQKLVSYKGDYEYYLEEKALRQDQLQKEFDNQQQFIKQQERFIERFKAKASKATQAKSVQKKLDRIDRITIPTYDKKEMNLKFKQKRPSGKIVVELENVSKSYPNKPLFESATATINRGDKIGLVGANGVGKTTLLNIIADKENYTGTNKLGHHVDISFYAQHQIEALHPDNNLMAEVASAESTLTDQDVRRTLGCFLFSGDDVFKKTKVLSGGEKSRVALAKVLVSNSNFLLLDEPTNHLDMVSKDILIDALDEYEGTIVMVSHDREFISRTCNKIWEIIDGKIKEFPGTFDEWKIWKEAQSKPQTKQEKIEKKVEKPQPVANTAEAKLYKEQQKEKRKWEQKLQKTEEELNKYKEEENKLLEKLGDPNLYQNQEEWKKTEADYNAAKAKIPAKEKEYEEVFEKLMTFEEN